MSRTFLPWKEVQKKMFSQWDFISTFFFLSFSYSFMSLLLTDISSKFHVDSRLILYWKRKYCFEQILYCFLEFGLGKNFQCLFGSWCARHYYRYLQIVLHHCQVKLYTFFVFCLFYFVFFYIVIVYILLYNFVLIKMFS